ncbi:hypothetical protein [Cribrihabitans marinus]|nr:hypothetical protein [Cribrihabitans marinus]
MGTLVATALSISSTMAVADQHEDLTLLFVQTSASMKSDAQHLRMIDVGEQTVYFSDRPNRVAGHIHLDKFVTGWSKGEDSFAENPPNAVLSEYGDKSEENNLVVIELSAPVLDGDDLVYSYKTVDGTMPKSGGASSLFIDTFGPGGGVGAVYHGVGVGRRGPGATGWAGVAVRNCGDGDC